jgi:hypothetical protein
MPSSDLEVPGSESPLADPCRSFGELKILPVCIIQKANITVRSGCLDNPFDLIVNGELWGGGGGGGDDEVCSLVTPGRTQEDYGFLTRIHSTFFLDHQEDGGGGGS